VAGNATRRGTLYQRQTFDATRGRPQHWLVMRRSDCRTLRSVFDDSLGRADDVIGWHRPNFGVRSTVTALRSADAPWFTEPDRDVVIGNIGSANDDRKQAVDFNEITGFPMHHGTAVFRAA
jgi:hypothetical protein